MKEFAPNSFLLEEIPNHKRLFAQEGRQEVTKVACVTIEIFNVYSKRKKFAPEEQILSYLRRLLIRRGSLHRKANRKSQKLSSL